MALVGAVLSAEGAREQDSTAVEGADLVPQPKVRPERRAGKDSEPTPRQAAVVRERAAESQPEPQTSSRGIAARQAEPVARTEPEPAAPDEAAAPEPEERPKSRSEAGGARDIAWFRDNWEQILEAVKSRNRSVVALLNGSCEPTDVGGNVLTVGFYHDFHKKMMDQDKNKSVLEEALSELTGGAMAVKCVLFHGDRDGRSAQRQQEVKEKKEIDLKGSDPIVQEAVNRYGARVTSVRPVKE
jgi:DNA polymerase-3 subunit gamma/tau